MRLAKSFNSKDYYRSFLDHIQQHFTWFFYFMEKFILTSLISKSEQLHFITALKCDIFSEFISNIDSVNIYGIRKDRLPNCKSENEVLSMLYLCLNEQKRPVSIISSSKHLRLRYDNSRVQNKNIYLVRFGLRTLLGLE